MRKIFLSTDKNIPAPCSQTDCFVSIRKFLLSTNKKQPIVSLRKNSSARSQKFKNLGPGGEKSFTGIQFCCQNCLFQPKIQEFWDPAKEKFSLGYKRKFSLHMNAAGLRKKFLRPAGIPPRRYTSSTYPAACASQSCL